MYSSESAFYMVPLVLNILLTLSITFHPAWCCGAVTNLKKCFASADFLSTLIIYLTVAAAEALRAAFTARMSAMRQAATSAPQGRGKVPTTGRVASGVLPRLETCRNTVHITQWY